MALRIVTVIEPGKASIPILFSANKVEKPYTLTVIVHGLSDEWTSMAKGLFPEVNFVPAPKTVNPFGSLSYGGFIDALPEAKDTDLIMYVDSSCTIQRMLTPSELTDMKYRTKLDGVQHSNEEVNVNILSACKKARLHEWAYGRITGNYEYYTMPKYLFSRKVHILKIKELYEQLLLTLPKVADKHKELVQNILFSCAIKKSRVHFEMLSPRIANGYTDEFKLGNISKQQGELYYSIHKIAFALPMDIEETCLKKEAVIKPLESINPNPIFFNTTHGPGLRDYIYTWNFGSDYPSMWEQPVNPDPSPVVRRTPYMSEAILEAARRFQETIQTDQNSTY